MDALPSPDSLPSNDSDPESGYAARFADGLPSDDDLVLDCCNKGCMAKFASAHYRSHMADWTIHKRTLTNDGMSTMVFDMLKEAKRRGECYQFIGVPCCRKAFLEVCGIGVSKLTRMQSSLDAHDAPRDLRHSRVVEPSSVSALAGRFFQMLWSQGEPYASDLISWAHSGVDHIVANTHTPRRPPSNHHQHR